MSTNTTRFLALGISMLAVLVIGSARTALAQPGMPNAATPPFTLSFDENGASLLNGGPNPNQVTPVAGVGIEYFLPGQVTPGFVLVQNPLDVSTANPNGDTDLLTFTSLPDLNGVLRDVMIFASLKEDADDTALADVPSLNFMQPALTTPETGPEGNNTFLWTVPGASYFGISDGVLNTPEPSTFIMGGMGLIAMGAMAYRRRRARLAVAVLLLLAMTFSTATVAQAQPGPGAAAPGSVGFTLDFDEQGNSLLNGGPNPNPVTILSSGGIQFVLPVPVITGDVLIRGLSDVNALNPGISDLLSFSNQGNQGLMTYYSLIDDVDSNVDPADVASFNTVTPWGATEFGPEGSNGFQWIPDPLNLAGSIYNGVSDGVLSTPEPSTFLLGGMGLIALGAMAHRRRLARAG